MFRRNLVPVWIGILLLSGMFLMGQEAWQPPTPEGMASIPVGSFMMGDSYYGDWDEGPAHSVYVSAFYIDVHEVTNAEYKSCVNAGKCTTPASLSSATRSSYYGNAAYDDFPVIWVDWQQAKDYCTWVGKRLPSEAEWERAARGGFEGKQFPGGDTISGTDANFWGSGDPWDNDTSQVEHYAPNGFGLYDVAGNVWEWVNDWYQGDYYTVSPPTDPQGPTSGTLRVNRGGGWLNGAWGLRVADRNPGAPNFENPDLGFRCAK